MAGAKAKKCVCQEQGDVFGYSTGEQREVRLERDTGSKLGQLNIIQMTQILPMFPMI